MLIRKLVLAATLAAAGAAAHAGAISSSAGGKDVGKLTDSRFSSKMYTGLALYASPAAAPVAAPGAAPLAAPVEVAVAAPVAAPIYDEQISSIGAVDTAPAAAGDSGSGATIILPMPAQISAIEAADLVTPMADVPEPASLALMLAGMVGVGAMRRRKQQR